MSDNLVPASRYAVESWVKNSHFIATIGPAFSVSEAREFIAEINQLFKDATHNVPAYIIGHGSMVISHCNDDGEPSGTAGRPVLAVLRGSDLGDVVIVVTRYFGGTKLGTGGLVRAYRDAARAVLQELPRGVKVPTHKALVVTPYSLFERIQHTITAHQGQVLDVDFAADITITAQLVVHEFPRFQSHLQEMSRGRVEVEVVETNPDTVIPLDDEGS